MNLILLQTEDFISDNRVRLSGRRLDHLRTVLRAGEGQSVRVGQLGGLMGTGSIVSLRDDVAELQLLLTQSPPEPLPLTLLLALPRPKMLKRVLQGITSFGVKTIYLVNSYRVEKSFWGSPLLQPERLREQLLAGLEQACDTVMPEIHLRKRFKPFVEDELPAICRGTIPLVAHPSADAGMPMRSAEPTTLAIGPEGGFIPYEVASLSSVGFSPVSIGERILRVEVAVQALLSRFLPAGGA